MKRYLYVLLLFIVLNSSLVASNNTFEVRSDILTLSQQQYLQEKKEILYCVDPNWFPFEAIVDGVHKGIVADVFSLIKEKIDIPTKLVVTKTWEDSLFFVKTRKCDMLVAAAQTTERDKFLNFTKAYLTFPQVVVTRGEVPFFEDFKSVIHKKIGIVKDSAISEIIKEKYPNINLVDVVSVADGLMQVSQGKVFGFVNTSAAVSYYIAKEGLTNLKIASKVGIDYHIKTAIRNDDKVLLDIFNQLINNLDQNKIDDIKENWLQVKMQQVIDYSLIYKTVGFFVLVILIILYWNRKLNIEIQYREVLQKELKRAKKEAVAANNAKSEFLANMSHEIRTPMNAVLGMLYLLEKTQISDIQKSYIKKAGYAANSLLHIINDILDFSKIEAGKLDIKNGEFEFNEMILDVLGVMRFKAEEKKLELLADYDTTIPGFIISDSLRIGQILNNLISNAIKFTAQGEVVVSTKLLFQGEKNIEILFCVKDSGIGISEESQKLLFQEFTQVDNSISRSFQGTGLGLAISKKLAILLGGDIWIEDSKENVGSTFCFKIKAKVSDKKTNSIPLKGLVVDDNSKNNKYFDGKKILLVEDNKLNQEFATIMLEHRGFIVDIANDGLQAVTKIEKNIYDVVLMDIQMPNMDGLEATRKIRSFSQEYFQQIPIIALSANALQGDKEKSLEAGMNEHITKPIDPEKLFETLEKFVVSNTRKEQEINLIKYNLLEHLDNTTFDVKSTLIKLNNHEEIYIKILKQFRENYQDFYKDIFSWITSKNFDMLKTKVHEVKGLSGNIGATKLYEILTQIDALVKKEQLPSSELLEKLQIELSKSFQAIDNLEVKNIQSKQFDTTKVKELLEKIVQNLEVDISMCEETLEEVVPYLQDSYGDFVKQLITSLEQFDTDKAKELIEIFLKEEKTDGK